jgi:hypothetical protein
LEGWQLLARISPIVQLCAKRLVFYSRVEKERWLGRELSFMPKQGNYSIQPSGCLIRLKLRKLSQ